MNLLFLIYGHFAVCFCLLKMFLFSEAHNWNVLKLPTPLKSWWKKKKERVKLTNYTNELRQVYLLTHSLTHSTDELQ